MHKWLFKIKVTDWKNIYDTIYIQTRFLYLLEFKLNFTYKYFIKRIINKVISILFNPGLNNTPMNHNFKSGKFRPTNLILNRHNYFLTE